MTNDEARKIVVAAISSIAPDADTEALAGDDDLFDALELDSMDQLNIVVAVNQETGLEIPERDYPKLTTVDRFAGYLVGAASAG